MTKTPQALSIGEETFMLHIRAKLHPVNWPVREYRFTADRGWRFDFAWPDRKIAVEIEGGTSFGRSRHSTGDGFEKDAEKYNRAAREGWIVLRYSTRMVTNGSAIDEVMEALDECDLSRTQATPDRA